MSKEKKPVRKPSESVRQEQGWFEKLSTGKKDLLSILFLFVLVLVLFYKVVFNNMIFFNAADTAAAQSWTKAGTHLEETEHTDPLWIPYVFSGMPGFASLAYGSRSVSYLQGALHFVGKLLFLNADDGWLVLHYFLSGLFMFLLARRWNLSHMPSLFAAVTFMLSPYSINLASEGHGSKLMALSYLPAVVLVTDLLLERRDLLSFGLFAAGLGTLLLTGHVQIVYYVFIVIGLWLLYQVVIDFKENKLLGTKKVALFVCGMALGFAISAFVYLSVNEYAQYSIRGGGTTGSSGGLSWEYATGWSFHPLEMMDFLMPSFFGFPLYYWGTMPFSNAAFYVGIIPLLLSVIALIYRRNRTTVFLAALSALVFLISFGKHFGVLYELMFNYLPYFNKFRAPSMILHLIAFTMGILGAYGLSYLIDLREKIGDSTIEKLKRGLLYAGGGLVALLVLGFLLKSSLYGSLSSFMFVREGEFEQYQQQYGQQTSQVIAQLKQLRFDLLWKDFVKFVFVSAGSIGIILLFLNRKIRAGLFSAAVIGILLIDLFIVIKAGNFIDPKPNASLEQSFAPDATVTYLKQQPGLFRVFPIGQLFMENTYMYHVVQSIGGYSPAKLKIYQTMLDSCLYQGPDPKFPLNMNIVNMLNARYIIAQGQLPSDRFELVNVDQAKRALTYKNPHALPRAFFVGSALVAHSDREVFRFLNSEAFDAATTAIIEKPLPQEIHKPDSSFAEVTDFKSGEVTVKAYTSSPALLVLSEVYYPAGWSAYIDGAATEIFKTNYVLRSIVVPAGQHEIAFRFEPSSYKTGLLASNISWGIAVAFILIGLWRIPTVRMRPMRKTEAKTDNLAK
jgi:hypothetical protein